MQLFTATNTLLLQLCCFLIVAASGEELPCDPPCQHGKCTAYLGELSCQCFGNWSGPACDESVCDTASPCLNNGVCTMLLSNSSFQYTCSCPLGYTGEHCQYMVPRGAQNNCSNTTCGSHGVCYIDTERDSSFFCDCNEGHYGPTCNYTTNPCATESCHGHGHCKVIPTVKGNPFGWCTCDEDYGFSGHPAFLQCAILKRVDHCKLVMCQNGAECQLLPYEGYRCICPPNFQGHHCEIPFDVCSDQSRCLNGGHCIPDGHYFNCSCPPNYTGDRCETLIDPCFGKTCLNEGYCVVDKDSTNGTNDSTARCECPCGYSGEHCEVVPQNRVARSDPCTPNPCEEGGVCMHKDTAPWFTCHCMPGFTGPLCERIDHCSKLLHKSSANHCKECVNTKESCHCVCENGWGGQLCDQDIDECFGALKPCPEGQKCDNQKGTFNCV